MNAIEKIKKSDIIYKDICIYVEEYLFNKKGTYLYFKDYFDVKNYLQENSRYINPELLDPTEELWSDLLNDSYYEHKDIHRRIGQLYENIRRNMGRKKKKDLVRGTERKI